VARLLLGLAAKMQADPSYAGAAFELGDFSGQPGLLVRLDGRVVVAMQLETDGNVIQGLRAVLNPDKLGGLQR
jgi:hypothetical protein